MHSISFIIKNQKNEKKKKRVKRKCRKMKKKEKEKKKIDEKWILYFVVSSLFIFYPMLIKLVFVVCYLFYYQFYLFN